MRDAFYSQPPVPGAPWRQPSAPQVPTKQARFRPQGAANRWMGGVGAIALTMLAVLLAFLAPHAISVPPSTARMTLVYQGSLTKNDKRWQAGEKASCQFTSTGYEVAATDPHQEAFCILAGSTYSNFLLSIHVVDAEQTALIGFLANDRLAISGDGRFQFYRDNPLTGESTFLDPPTGIGAGSVALHPIGLGVSSRTNEIVIQVQRQTYSFYANGQLLATYISPLLEDPGPIALGAAGGGNAEFSDIAIYAPGSSA